MRDIARTSTSTGLAITINDDQLPRFQGIYSHCSQHKQRLSLSLDNLGCKIIPQKLTRCACAVVMILCTVNTITMSYSFIATITTVNLDSHGQLQIDIYLNSHKTADSNSITYNSTENDKNDVIKEPECLIKSPLPNHDRCPNVTLCVCLKQLCACQQCPFKIPTTQWHIKYQLQLPAMSLQATYHTMAHQISALGLPIDDWQACASLAAQESFFEILIQLHSTESFP